MTVKDVARYLKLSEMMIYKLAQGAEIPAAKVGSAWRFSEAAIDEWLSKKTRAHMTISGLAGDALRDFIADLKNIFGDDFTSVIVFGSYARGEASPDSDLDVLVVLKKISGYWKTKSRIEEIAYGNTFDKGRSIVMAPIVMSEAAFLTGASPLLINIRKEGMKAA